MSSYYSDLYIYIYSESVNYCELLPVTMSVTSVAIIFVGTPAQPNTFGRFHTNIGLRVVWYVVIYDGSQPHRYSNG